MSHSFWKLEIQHQGHQHGWFLVRGLFLVADGYPYTLGGGVPSFCSLTLLSKGLIWEVGLQHINLLGSGVGRIQSTELDLQSFRITVITS